MVDHSHLEQPVKGNLGGNFEGKSKKEGDARL